MGLAPLAPPPTRGPFLSFFVFARGRTGNVLRTVRPAGKNLRGHRPILQTTGARETRDALNWKKTHDNAEIQRLE